MASFFTHTLDSSNHTVPHGRIGERWLRVVHLAIVRSFEIIRAESSNLESALENEVTEALENVLENQIRNRGEVDGFDSVFFGKVTRGNEVVNFDGTKISKKPDLVFHLRRENRIDWDQTQDALFAECKPVDKKHTLNANYCAFDTDRTGIERFIIGDYAWAMQEAMMIGYVRDGFNVLPDLEHSLSDATRCVKLGNPTRLKKIMATAPDGTSAVFYKTTHERSFPWKNKKPATPIDLFHSWHDCF